MYMKPPLFKRVLAQLPLATPALIHLVDNLGILIEIATVVKCICAHDPLKEILVFAVQS